MQDLDRLRRKRPVGPNEPRHRATRARKAACEAGCDRVARRRDDNGDGTRSSERRYCLEVTRDDDQIRFECHQFRRHSWQILGAAVGDPPVIDDVPAFNPPQLAQRRRKRPPEAGSPVGNEEQADPGHLAGAALGECRERHRCREDEGAQHRFTPVQSITLSSTERRLLGSPRGARQHQVRAVRAPARLKARSEGKRYAVARPGSGDGLPPGAGQPNDGSQMRG